VVQKSHRIIALLFACVSLGLGLFSYFEFIYQLGFPNGFISELARAQRRLAYIFIAISVIFSAWFVFLGIVAGRKQALSVAVILYLVTLASIVLVDFYYRSNLMGSGG
jgi:hypothetical protein